MAWACIGAFLLLILYINYDAYLSPEATAAKLIAKNIRQVRVGMDTTQVNFIMGKPAWVSNFKQEHTYSYTHQPGSSDSYQIKFDAAHRVIAVYILD